MCSFFPINFISRDRLRRLWACYFPNSKKKKTKCIARIACGRRVPGSEAGHGVLDYRRRLAWIFVARRSWKQSKRQVVWPRARWPCTDRVRVQGRAGQGPLVFWALFSPVIGQTSLHDKCVLYETPAGPAHKLATVRACKILPFGHIHWGLVYLGIFFQNCYSNSFVCMWQILSKHRLTRFKRFVS